MISAGPESGWHEFWCAPSNFKALRAWHCHCVIVAPGLCQCCLAEYIALTILILHVTSCRYHLLKHNENIVLMPQIQSAKDVMETLSDTVSTFLPQSTSRWLISSKFLLSFSMSVFQSLLLSQAPVAGQGRQRMLLTESFCVAYSVTRPVICLSNTVCTKTACMGIWGSLPGSAL